MTASASQGLGRLIPLSGGNRLSPTAGGTAQGRRISLSTEGESSSPRCLPLVVTRRGFSWWRMVRARMQEMIQAKALCSHGWPWYGDCPHCDDDRVVAKMKSQDRYWHYDRLVGMNVPTMGPALACRLTQ